MPNRIVISIVKLMNRTRSMMNTTFPIVFKPGKVYGCRERRAAIAPVDIVHSNHAQVK